MGVWSQRQNWCTCKSFVRLNMKRRLVGQVSGSKPTPLILFFAQKFAQPFSDGATLTRILILWVVVLTRPQAFFSLGSFVSAVGAMTQQSLIDGFHISKYVVVDFKMGKSTRQQIYSSLIPCLPENAFWCGGCHLWPFQCNADDVLSVLISWPRV